MKMLILGGTVFVGRHLVDAALDGGHDVTLLHRGRHASHRPHDVRELLGDRDGDLSALGGWSGDAVIDTSGYVPRIVRRTLDVLGSIDHYTFVSSGSVYADLSMGPITERTPVHEPPAADVEDPSGEHYGPLKVGCERELAGRFGTATLIQRAGLIVGPHDPTDRFTYWVRRMSLPGPALAPDVPGAPVQVIDARDLAAWTVASVEAGVAGVMNVAGERGITFGDVIRRAADVAGRPADVRWVDQQRLLDAGVQPWSELPLWLPASSGALGMMDMDTTLAQQHGLTWRPLDLTMADTLAWDREAAHPVDHDYGTRFGRQTLSSEREREVLAALLDEGPRITRG